MWLWLVAIVTLVIFASFAPYAARNLNIRQALRELQISAVVFVIGIVLIVAAPTSERADIYPPVTVVFGFVIIDALVLYWVNKRIYGDSEPT